jgi:hypothetical protein
VGAALPYVKLFPYKAAVLATLERALDDRKRSVRAEAVRAKHVWMGLA